MNFNRLFSRFYTNIISWDGRRRAASLAALALALAAVCASSINAQQRRGEPAGAACDSKLGVRDGKRQNPHRRGERLSDLRGRRHSSSDRRRPRTHTFTA